VKELVQTTRFKMQKTLNLLRSYTKQRTHRLERACKTARKNILKDERYFFDKVRGYVQNKKRTKVNSKIISMMFCIKKNHKFLQRKALHHWAGTETKQKVKTLD